MCHTSGEKFCKWHTFWHAVLAVYRKGNYFAQPAQAFINDSFQAADHTTKCCTDTEPYKHNKPLGTDCHEDKGMRCAGRNPFKPECVYVRFKTKVDARV